jgi:hypothetical protein
MNSFNEYELFKKLMMPKTLGFLANKSQGIHLNIDISDIPTLKLKDILINDYYPWEKAHARIVRPNKSIYARELEYQDIIKMNTFRTLDQFSTLFFKLFTSN